MKYNENSSSGSQGFILGRTDGRRDRQTDIKEITGFFKFCERTDNKPTDIHYHYKQFVLSY